MKRQSMIAILTVLLLITSKGAELRYQPDENAITARLWSIGPDGIDDNGMITYDPTNGLTSRGDIVYPADWDAPTSATIMAERLRLAHGNVNRVGNALVLMHNDAIYLPQPTLHDKNQIGMKLTTPIAYLGTQTRNASYDTSSTTLEAKIRIRQVADALNQYWRGTGAYPATLSGPPPVEYPPFPYGLPAALIDSRYIDSIPRDPFRPQEELGYQSRHPQQSPNDYLLYSVGPDGYVNTMPGFRRAYWPDVINWARGGQYNLETGYGDIIFTSRDGFGESPFIDPFELLPSGVSDWQKY